jgi:hypothetical protein
MRRFVTGAALACSLALAVPVAAAPGQCSMTGQGEFPCDVNVDGGGITFTLPSGETFVFAHEANGEGLGYLIAAEPQPGRRPEELGRFVPVEGQDGCWFGEQDEITFCAALEQ